MTPQALPPLLFETLPALRLMGIRTLLPRALERLLRPRLSMQVKAKNGSSASFLKTDDLFSFDWKVSLGDERITPTEFERLSARPPASCGSAASTSTSTPPRSSSCVRAWRGPRPYRARSCCAWRWPARSTARRSG